MRTGAVQKTNPPCPNCRGLKLQGPDWLGIGSRSIGTVAYEVALWCRRCNHRLRLAGPFETSREAMNERDRLVRTS